MYIILQKKAVSQAIGGDDSRANLLKLHYGTVLTQHCETLLAPNYVTALAPHYETDCVTVQASCQTFPARVKHQKYYRNAFP